MGEKKEKIETYIPVLDIDKQEYEDSDFKKIFNIASLYETSDPSREIKPSVVLNVYYSCGKDIPKVILYLDNMLKKDKSINPATIWHTTNKIIDDLQHEKAEYEKEQKKLSKDKIDSSEYKNSIMYIENSIEHLEKIRSDVWYKWRDPNVQQKISKKRKSNYEPNDYVNPGIDSTHLNSKINKLDINDKTPTPKPRNINNKPLPKLVTNIQDKKAVPNEIHYTPVNNKIIITKRIEPAPEIKTIRKEPIQPNIKPQVPTPTQTPVQSRVQTPTQTPVQSRVQTPTQTPVQSRVQTPVQNPVKPLVQPQTITIFVSYLEKTFTKTYNYNETFADLLLDIIVSFKKIITPNDTSPMTNFDTHLKNIANFFNNIYISQVDFKKDGVWNPVTLDDKLIMFTDIESIGPQKLSTLLPTNFVNIVIALKSELMPPKQYIPQNTPQPVPIQPIQPTQITLKVKLEGREIGTFICNIEDSILNFIKYIQQDLSVDLSKYRIYDGSNTIPEDLLLFKIEQLTSKKIKDFFIGNHSINLGKINVPNQQKIQHIQEPIVQPTIQQHTHQPIIQPTIQHHTQQPIVQPTIQHHTQQPVVQPTIQQHTQQPVVQPTIQHHTQQPVVQPTIQQHTQQPVVQPTIQQHTQQPVVQPTIQHTQHIQTSQFKQPLKNIHPLNITNNTFYYDDNIIIDTNSDLYRKYIDIFIDNVNYPIYVNSPILSKADLFDISKDDYYFKIDTMIAKLEKNTYEELFYYCLSMLRFETNYISIDDIDKKGSKLTDHLQMLVEDDNANEDHDKLLDVLAIFNITSYIVISYLFDNMFSELVIRDSLFSYLNMVARLSKESVSEVENEKWKAFTLQNILEMSNDHRTCRRLCWQFAQLIFEHKYKFTSNMEKKVISLIFKHQFNLLEAMSEFDEQQTVTD